MTKLNLFNDDLFNDSADEEPKLTGTYTEESDNSHPAVYAEHYKVDGSQGGFTVKMALKKFVNNMYFREPRSRTNNFSTPEATSAFVLINCRCNGTSEIQIGNDDPTSYLDLTEDYARAVGHDIATDLCDAEAYDVLADVVVKLVGRFLRGFIHGIPKNHRVFLKSNKFIEKYGEKLYNEIKKQLSADSE